MSVRSPLGRSPKLLLCVVLLVLIIACTQFCELKKTKPKSKADAAVVKAPTSKNVNATKTAKSIPAVIKKVAAPKAVKKDKKALTERQQKVFDLTKCLIKKVSVAPAVSAFKSVFSNTGKSSLYVQVEGNNQTYVLTNSPLYAQLFAHDRRIQWLSFFTLSYNTHKLYLDMDDDCGKHPDDIYESAIMSFLRTQLEEKYRKKSPQSSKIDVCISTEQVFRRDYICAVVEKKVKIPGPDKTIISVQISSAKKFERVDYIWMIFLSMGAIAIFVFWVFLSMLAISLFPVHYWPEEPLHVDRVFPVYWGSIDMIRSMRRTDSWGQFFKAFFVYYLKVNILSAPMIWVSISLLFGPQFASWEFFVLSMTHFSILIYSLTFFWMSRNEKIEKFIKENQDTCSVFTVLALYYGCLKYEHPSPNIGISILKFLRDTCIALGMFAWLGLMSLSFCMLTVCLAVGILTSVRNFALLVVVVITFIITGHAESAKVESPMHRLKKVVCRLLIDRRKRRYTALVAKAKASGQNENSINAEDIPLTSLTYHHLYEMLNVLEITPSHVLMRRLPNYPVSLGFMLLILAVLKACSSGLEIGVVLNLSILVLIQKKLQIESADAKAIFEMRLTYFAERWIEELEQQNTISDPMKVLLQEMRDNAKQFGAEDNLAFTLMDRIENQFF